MAPVLTTPVKLYVDASDYGAGAVLLQESTKIDHPISYVPVSEI